MAMVQEPPVLVLELSFSVPKNFEPEPNRLGKVLGDSVPVWVLAVRFNGFSLTV